MPNNYIHASNTIFIGTLNRNNQFRFSGEIKNIKLGSGLIEPNQSLTDNEYTSINDTPVVISDLAVCNLINIIDQYSS
jgi:hypothetical protein